MSRNSTDRPQSGRQGLLAARHSGQRALRTRCAIAAALTIPWLANADAAALTVHDDTGRAVTLSAVPERIASLAPGATEMLFAVGAGDHVIGTVEYSDEPAAARKVPRIGDVVAIDMERLLSARPQVVVVWPGGSNTAQVNTIAAMGIPIYRQQVNRLAELPGSLRRLGALAGTAPVAEQTARELEARLAKLTRTYASHQHRTVLLQVWNHPVYTVGGTELISDVLNVCGTDNIFADLHEMSPAVNEEAVVARDPDIIVAAAPPGAGSQWLAQWRRFPALRAVRKGNLFAFEDQRLTRLGPSVVAATEGLCKVLATAH